MHEGGRDPPFSVVRTTEPVQRIPAGRFLPVTADVYLIPAILVHGRYRATGNHGRCQEKAQRKVTFFRKCDFFLCTFSFHVYRTFILQNACNYPMIIYTTDHLPPFFFLFRKNQNAFKSENKLCHLNDQFNLLLPQFNVLLFRNLLPAFYLKNAQNIKKKVLLIVSRDGYLACAQ